MVIQLPKDIEARLNELAEREGKPVQELATDAIKDMLERRGRLDRWPPPRVVGLVGGGDSEADDRAASPSPSSSRPWSGMIGMLSDGGVPVTEFDEWLEAARASDERLVRKTSPKE